MHEVEVCSAVPLRATQSNSCAITVTKFSEALSEPQIDWVSAEEPLEIRLAWAGSERVEQIAVTMRTPGRESELAVGFLFTEGIISSAECIASIDASKCNLVTVQLRPGYTVDSKVFERHSFVASSCGVCGKKSIEAVRVKRSYECATEAPIVPASLIKRLPELMRQSQPQFDQTGGIHASCLFDISGEVVAIAEDVGRHNALDKLIGEQLLKARLPLTDKILLVSGRASFELVQKAAHAGIPVMAAVGAPSSLAVRLAEESGITLIGFVRAQNFNAYCGIQRIATSF